MLQSRFLTRAGVQLAAVAALTLAGFAAASAETKWDMPTPYGDGNFHTQNIAAFAEDVKDKTGGLFRLSVGLMQAFATTNKDSSFTSLVNNLALYFQIRDDYINLADEEYMKIKTFCEDLTEGKFSFPIIHCIG